MVHQVYGTLKKIKNELNNHYHTKKLFMTLIFEI